MEDIIKKVVDKVPAEPITCLSRNIGMNPTRFSASEIWVVFFPLNTQKDCVRDHETCMYNTQAGERLSKGRDFDQNGKKSCLDPIHNEKGVHVEGVYEGKPGKEFQGNLLFDLKTCFLKSPPGPSSRAEEINLQDAIF